MQTCRRAILSGTVPQNSLGQVDSTRINLKLTTSSVRNVTIAPILNHGLGIGGLTDGPLVIPANTVKTFHAQFTNNYPIDFTLLTIAPHMHLIGKSIKSFFVYNGDTTPLIKINNWDFKWQGQYAFQKPIKFPKNAKAYAEATYDNTVNNPLNPNVNNPVTVTLGRSGKRIGLRLELRFKIRQPRHVRSIR